MLHKDLDFTDRKLLKVLRENGRISNAELADQIAISQSPCSRRMKRLETMGVISGYQAKLDYKKLGWEIMAFIHIKSIKRGSADDVFFREELMKVPQVLSCYALAGAWDMLLHVVAKDLDDYYELAMGLGALEYVREIESTIVIGCLKDDYGAPVP